MPGIILQPIPTASYLALSQLSLVQNYPLLLDPSYSPLSRPVAKEHPHSNFDMLKAGVKAAKRVADRVNKTICEAENALEAAFLQSQVDDWKGYNFETFGKLILQNIPVERNLTGALPASPTSQKAWRQSNMKLLLKGKVHVNNTVTVETAKSSSLPPSYHLLAVWWEASKDDDLNYFVIQA
ncbi:hypothetical protein L218DRAFT_949184 [Marasmius fiardii PR-910]|nr:hypothetical protein L218DRAFT_949184 [Marasmius fiardii PR-910]